MHCLQCGGSFEYAGANKEYARCTKCLALHQVVRPGHVQMMDVRTPTGQVDPNFTAMVAQNLGFAPRQAQQHVVGMGGVNIVVPTARIQQNIANKISGMIWGWIITGIVLVVLAIGGLIFFFYIRAQIAESTSGDVPAAGPAKAASWDGTSMYMCGGNQNVVLKNVNASITSGTAVMAGGNCQLVLENCNIASPDDTLTAGGNAKVTVKGGSIKATGTGTAIMAGGAAQVTVDGAKITGKTTAGAGGKITGVK